MFLDSAVKKYIVVYCYNYGNPHFQEGIKTFYILLLLFIHLKTSYLRELILIIMDVQTRPEIIRHLWISAPFKKRALSSVYPKTIPVDNISGFIVFFLRNFFQEMLNLNSWLWFHLVESRTWNRFLCKWCTEIMFSGEAQEGWGEGQSAREGTKQSWEKFSPRQICGSSRAWIAPRVCPIQRGTCWTIQYPHHQWLWLPLEERVGLGNPSGISEFGSSCHSRAFLWRRIHYKLSTVITHRRWRTDISTTTSLFNKN